MESAPLLAAMFNKLPPKKSPLTDRVRHVAERKAPPLPQEAAPPRQREERQDRRPLFRQATLLLQSGHPVRVAIKNLSATGARIEFFAVAELPDEVVLSEPTLNLRRRAKVIWQRDGMAGLQFFDR